MNVIKFPRRPKTSNPKVTLTIRSDGMVDVDVQGAYTDTQRNALISAIREAKSQLLRRKHQR